MFLVLSVIRFVNYTLGNHYDIPDGYIVGLVVYEEITGTVGKEIHFKKIMIVMRVHYSTAAGNVAETEKFFLVAYYNADNAHLPNGILKIQLHYIIRYQKNQEFYIKYIILYQRI